jgi:AmmeMemoRadiSam system protein B
MELRNALQKNFDGLGSGCDEDRFRDNTIEVLLPMVRYFFQQSSLVWIRLPAAMESFEAGKIIAQTAAKLNRKIDVLASTDLTHYGVNYDFSPKGSGQSALSWVRDVNDAAFIRAVEEGNKEGVLKCARDDYAACSAGAVLGAMGFAQEAGLGGARLLEYSTSADVANEANAQESASVVPDSFVGYAALKFDKNA